MDNSLLKTHDTMSNILLHTGITRIQCFENEMKD